LLTNCYAETGPDAERIVKRPGTALRANLGGDCPGQGAFFFAGGPVFIVCDELFTELPPAEVNVALSGVEATGAVGTMFVSTDPQWVWVVVAPAMAFQKTFITAGCGGSTPYKRVWTSYSNYSFGIEVITFGGAHPPVSGTWDAAARMNAVGANFPNVTETYYSSSSGTPFNGATHGFYDNNVPVVFATSPCVSAPGLTQWDIDNNLDNNSQVSEFAFVWIMPENIMYALTTADWRSDGPPPAWGIKTAVLDALQSYNRPIYYPDGATIYWTP